MKNSQTYFEVEQKYEYIVCGAGLVGTLWALFLRRRSQSIAIFQKSSDVRSSLTWSGRSINMLITNKAIEALEQLGIREIVLSKSLPLKGRIIHSVDGTKTYIPFSSNPQDIAYCIQRNQLNKILLQIAQQNEIDTYFCYSFEDADFAKNQFIFSSEEEGSRILVRGNYLFGADGAGSKVRQIMHNQNNGLSTTKWFDIQYKQLFLPANQQGNPFIENDVLHVWPRGDHRLVAMPNCNGSFCLTLLLPAQSQLKGKQKILSHFQSNYKDIFHLIPNPVEQIDSNPIGLLGTLYCDQWALQSKAVLIGDSSHVLLPFLYQSMNAGYNDCFILDKLIDEYGFEHAFTKFYSLQKPNSDAISRLSLNQYYQHELSPHMTLPQYLLKQTMCREISKKYPNIFKSTEELIFFSELSYQEIEQQVLINRRKLDRILASLNEQQEIEESLVQKIVYEIQ